MFEARLNIENEILFSKFEIDIFSKPVIFCFINFKKNLETIYQKMHIISNKKTVTRVMFKTRNKFIDT